MTVVAFVLVIALALVGYALSVAFPREGREKQEKRLRAREDYPSRIAPPLLAPGLSWSRLEGVTPS